MYSVGKIQTNEIDIIWDCATNKHEAYKAAILKALTNLSSKLSLEHLKYLLLKIKALSFSDIDKFAIGLLRSIARKVSNSDNFEEMKSSVIQRGQSNSQKNKKRRAGMLNTNNIGGSYADDYLFPAE